MTSGENSDADILEPYDGSGLTDEQYHEYVVAKVISGLEAVECGETFTQAQVEEIFGKYLRG